MYFRNLYGNFYISLFMHINMYSDMKFKGDYFAVTLYCISYLIWVVIYYISIMYMLFTFCLIAILNKTLFTFEIISINHRDVLLLRILCIEEHKRYFLLTMRKKFIIKSKKLYIIYIKIINFETVIFSSSLQNLLTLIYVH